MSDTERLPGLSDEVTLERIPAEMFVILDKREKLACRPCEQGVAVAPLPDKVIDKGRPGPGLLADVIIGKYVDHPEVGSGVTPRCRSTRPK